MKKSKRILIGKLVKNWIKQMHLPIEVLASLKGCSLHIYPPYMSDDGGFCFRLSFQKYDKDFSGEYGVAKNAAIKYLNTLPDREDKKI